MANEIKGPGNNRPIQSGQPTEEAGTPPKAKGAGGPPPITTTEGKPGTPIITASTDIPVIRKPEGDNLLIEAELKTTIKYLQEFAKQLKQKVVINSGNMQALLHMYESTGSKFSKENLQKMTELLQGKSPEEQARLLDLALTKYAIGPDGKFTKEFIAFLQDPKIETPSGTNEEKVLSFSTLGLLLSEKPSLDSKNFSFFDLMLLLNKLSSSQRDAFFKGMQLEQKSIQERFTSKVENIKQKAIYDAVVAGLSAAVGGSFSFFGAMGGGAQGKEWAQMLTTAGRSIGDFASTGARSIVSIFFDPEKEKLEAEQQQHTFSKDAYGQAKQSSQELQNAVLQTADEYIRQLTAAKSTIRQNTA